MNCGREKQLNVLYLAPCGWDDGVGGGARLKNMLDVLGRLDAQTQLLSYRPGARSGLAHQRVDSHLKATTVSVKKSWPKPFKGLALGLILCHGLRYALRADVILAHAPGIASGFPALTLAKLVGKPAAIDHMDVKDPDTPGFLYRLVLKRADVTFAISRHLEKEADQIGSARVVYLPVFVDTDMFKPDPEQKSSVRAELAISDQEVVIGYAGSFSHVEGVPLLLRAFEKLSGRYSNLRLMIIGGRNVAGSDDIVRIAQSALEVNVTLVPQQPHHAMARYLSAFDIACSPKIYCAENRAANPIKIYEYMSMGLPVVVSAVGEPAITIKDGYDGFLVKPGDEADLCGALERAICNPDGAKQAGIRAREEVLKNYSQRVIETKVSDVLRSLVTRGRIKWKHPRST